MNVKSSFIFGTWNAGSKTEDYTQLFQNRKEAYIDSPNWGNLNSDNQDDIRMSESIDCVRNKLLGEVAKDLARAADVFALQEVSGDDRADITAFKKQGFEIIRPLKRNPNFASETDTAIAINRNKFQITEDSNRSFNDHYSGRDFAVAVVEEKATGKKIAFISGHIAGFNLEQKDLDKLKEDAAGGDQDIEGLVKKLKTLCSDCDTVLIGADMNANPEIYATRFKLIEDAGFMLHRTAKPTSKISRDFTGKTPTLQERELDYVFVQNKNPPNRFVAFLRNLFRKETIQITQLTGASTKLTLDAISCPSDHIPIFVKVEEVQNIFYRLFVRLKKLF